MKVSCIMPTANRAAYIPLAIHCFLSQTWEDRELIIVDDGAEPVAGIIPYDPRIRYAFVLGLGSLGNKRNWACRLASGEICLSWDDDDWYAPGRIADVVGLLISSGKAVAGYHRFYYWNEGDSRAYEYRYTGPGAYASGSTQCFRRSWWLGHKYPDLKTAEDSTFAMGAARAGQLASKPAGEMMVARGHSRNTWKQPWRSKAFPEVPRSALPAEFFRDMEGSRTPGSAATDNLK